MGSEDIDARGGSSGSEAVDPEAAAAVWWLLMVMTVLGGLVEAESEAVAAAADVVAWCCDENCDPDVSCLAIGGLLLSMLWTDQLRQPQDVDDEAVG